MFISTALAADTATSAAGSPAPMISGALPFLMILLVMYILIIRPNQKRIKEHENMVKSLRRGDKVITAGGIIGVISKVEDDNILAVEIAPEIKIRVMRDTISNVMNKNPVANDNKADNKTSDKSENK